MKVCTNSSKTSLLINMLKGIDMNVNCKSVQHSALSSLFIETRVKLKSKIVCTWPFSFFYFFLFHVGIFFNNFCDFLSNSSPLDQVRNTTTKIVLLASKLFGFVSSPPNFPVLIWSCSLRIWPLDGLENSSIILTLMALLQRKKVWEMKWKY